MQISGPTLACESDSLKVWVHDVLTSPSDGLPGSEILHATHIKKLSVIYMKFRFNCVSGIYLATISLGDSETHLTWIKWNMQKRAKLPISESALIHTNYGILAEQSCNCSMTQFTCVWNGDNNISLTGLLLELNELVNGKSLERCLRKGKQHLRVYHHQCFIFPFLFLHHHHSNCQGILEYSFLQFSYPRTNFDFMIELILHPRP